MPDILSQGGGRESGPWPRRVAAAVMLVLVAVTIVHYLPRSRHGMARPVRAAVPATPPLAVSGDAGVAEEPDGITGQLLSWPGGLRLPASGQRPVWYWPATGQVVPIGGLPLQQSGYQFIRAAGGWAVQAAPGAQTVCSTCAAQRRVYFLADGGRSVTRAGLADAVAPGTAGALWLTSYPPDADPRTAAVARCRVQVLNLATGRQVSVELPEASSVANAAFSPDGSFLAVQVSFGDDADDGALAVQLELASMASGRLTAVPETWVSSDALVGFGWPASSDSLVAELSFTTKVQLASWHPGASRLAIAVLRPQHSPASLVIGQYAP